MATWHRSKWSHSVIVDKVECQYGMFVGKIWRVYTSKWCMQYSATTFFAAQ